MLIAGLYTILSCHAQESHVEAIVMIQADHPLFKGHFPDHPVMPGVCMLQICKELTEQTTQKSLRFTHCKNVKFTAPVNPLKNPEIHLKFRLAKVEPSSYQISGAAYYGETLAMKFLVLLTS